MHALFLIIHTLLLIIHAPFLIIHSPFNYSRVNKYIGHAPCYLFMRE